MRNLLIFFLILIGVWWVRRALQRTGRSARRDERRQKLDEPERVLACRHCGVHVPESEGVRNSDGFYCCEAHQRQHGGDRGA